MILLPKVVFTAALLSIPLAGFAAEVPDDSLPVKSLIESADALLAAGDMHGALDHFEAAIKKDPTNYLTLFKRGAAYLSLGRSSQASADFDAVLNLKPDFEAALLQRARIKAKAGDWEGAKENYRAAGVKKHAEQIQEIEEAEVAAKEALKAESKGDWENCVTHAGTAIVTAAGMHSLRSLRAKCRLQRGEVHEAVGDLTHVAQLNPSSLEPHLQIANLLYYSVNDFERATAQLRKCLHSDPDSKSCSKLLRRLKNYNKSMTKIHEFREKRQYNSATKVLAGSGEDAGLIDEIKEDVTDLKKDGVLNDQCPQELMAQLQEMACDSYSELNKPEKARPFCDAALELNPNSLPAILAKANRLIKEDLFEEAVRVLDAAKEEHGQDRKLQKLLNEAHTLLRRSKSKDYYKVLDVSRDADDREIKKAYRKMTKKYHPDKYRGDLSAEEVQKKMSAINEAYEVLSNPELKQRFDNGDDPNDQTQQNPFQQGGNPFANFGGGGQQFMFRQGGGGFGGFGGGGSQFKFQF